MSDSDDEDYRYHHASDGSLGGSDDSNSGVTTLVNKADVMSEDGTSSTPFGGTSTSEEDDMDKAREVARQETARLRIWRFVVADTIVMIATVLILTTYTIRREAEHIKMAESFTQFANIVGDHVVEEQRVLRSSLYEFASLISASAQAANADWPYFTLPFFEAHARRVKDIAGLEGLSLSSVVSSDQRSEWVNYATEVHEELILNNHRVAGTQDIFQPVDYHSFISRLNNETGTFVEDDTRGYYFPSLTWSPPPLTLEAVNWNMGSDSGFGSALEALFQPLLNDEILYSVPTSTDPLVSTDVNHPLTYALTPVHQDLGFDTSQPVAVVSGVFAWEHFLSMALPEDVKGILVVVNATNCGPEQVSSYKINGPTATYLGPRDVHESEFEKYRVQVSLNPHSNETLPGHCLFQLELYPTTTYWDSYVSFNPEIYAMISALLFFLIAAVYFVYDKLVDQRNEKLVSRFARSNALVSSLFPKAYQDRLLGNDDNGTTTEGRSSKTLRAFMSSGVAGNAGEDASKPLADLFPEVSIVFADIVGFTAWSSVREPCHVFALLETLYSSFDDIAKTRRIFKVETVGDCYVAAAGLPEARRDHAVAIVRFSMDILKRMQVLTKQLEVSLGPDTGDLALRVGCHSGPVTAGILRGQKARFQLFGDTMNTASRIETTSKPGRIHISQSTADLLCKAGKGHWIQKRLDTVKAKGKGIMQTHWVTCAAASRGSESVSSGTSRNHEADLKFSFALDGMRKASQGSLKSANLSGRVDRLVEWNVNALLHLLKQVVARRNAQKEMDDGGSHRHQQRQAPETSPRRVQINPSSSSSKKLLPLDEVKEIIALPEFDVGAAQRQLSPDHVNIPPEVVTQLRNLVYRIAGMYNANSFHNFEHASHVTMSVTKLLSRIVSPTDLEMTRAGSRRGLVSGAASLHDHTYGITSDPLTQFACAFSALIHDVDHQGVPNAQLVKEGAEVATYYKGRSVAEQNSFDLGWAVLMDESMSDLRATLCASLSELEHFRELVINCVLATDIVDKELKALRNARWQKAFEEKPSVEEALTSTSRKATIVLEHLIQASDVAHTMQHWHIYRKWNERFFRECYQAYKEGRADADPRTYWYKGEIGFFDFYIIPLAKKLKDCGVFGVSSDEYLIYATQNRDEWESRGESIVADFIEKADRHFDHHHHQETGKAPHNEAIVDCIDC